MSVVGKKFPSLEVSAMNEMGDTIKVNVFEEATQLRRRNGRHDRSPRLKAEQINDKRNDH